MRRLASSLAARRYLFRFWLCYILIDLLLLVMFLVCLFHALIYFLGSKSACHTVPRRAGASEFRGFGDAAATDGS